MRPIKVAIPFKRQRKSIVRVVENRRRATKQWFGRTFAFLGAWKRAIAKRMNAIGRVIVRVSPPWLRAVGSFVKRPFVYLARRLRAFLRRRPHRSFRLTRRRDYKRSLALPGYWSFTNQVRAMLWRNKKLFGGLIVTYFVVVFAIQGIGQQEAYSNLSEALSEAGGEIFTGNMGKIGEAGLLLVTSISTGLTPNVTEAQSVLGGLTAFFAWLATVWALRNVMAGRRVRVRDAVYSSGSPVLPTVVVAFVAALQLIPLAVAVLVYNAAIESQLISGGVESMLIWIALALLAVLSLYWITSTLIALVVVTLPGMYPFQAIKSAGDLVIGRRLRILFRLLWAAVLTVLLWILIIIPIILLDAWLKKAVPAVDWLPIVPVSILLMSSITIVAIATYVYMLYRKVVDDDAKPA